jgi:hypothetical protein
VSPVGTTKEIKKLYSQQYCPFRRVPSSIFRRGSSSVLRRSSMMIPQFRHGGTRQRIVRADIACDDGAGLMAGDGARFVIGRARHAEPSGAGMA